MSNWLTHLVIGLAGIGAFTAFGVDHIIDGATAVTGITAILGISGVFGVAVSNNSATVSANADTVNTPTVTSKVNP